mgnify:CR=1 FL=1
MRTETKIVTAILAFTAIVIFGGILVVKNNFANQNAPQDYSKYIETGLNLDKTKIARDYNPKITGSGTSTATTTVHITEFLDYECPACATNGEIITKALLATYGPNITITRKIFPIHGQASIDVASLILASQVLGGDAYQKIHTKVYEEFSSWSILGKKDKDEYLKKLIIGLGYDYEKILAESKNEKYTKQIAQDKQDAVDLGIKATPSIVIENHTRITGGLPLEELSKYIDGK